MTQVVICIDVDNADRAVHFYRDGFGLTVFDRPILRRAERGDMANMSDPAGSGFDLIQTT